MIFKQNKFSSFCILILALVLHFSIANYSHAQEVNTGSDALDQGIVITEIEITGNQRIEENPSPSIFVKSRQSLRALRQSAISAL